jgi:repressor LexA
MPVTLYKRQKQILDFISQFIQKYGYSPSLKEISQAIGVISLATVHEHLASMEKKGVIRRYHGMIRGIEILDKRLEKLSGAVELPVLGFIAAGQPLEPYTDPHATLGVSPTLVSGEKRAFALQVKGDSMIEEGILEGDYVVVEEQETANNGDIVVALLNNGFATLKKFFKEATRVRLEPANSKMTPIFSKEVKIQGKVVAVIRHY